ncbi:MAG: hypothetical protein GF392_02760 [Candidatus Omnitrophica bacterium]|nr:hypothetical protein [Candidatus Omnitrophota bacterium]
MKCPYLSRKGMTLVEVVVSVALIALVVLSLVLTVTQSAVYSRRVDVLYTASYLAQRRIDMLNRLDFALLPEAAESSVRIGADGNIDPDGDYLRTTEIQENHDGNPFITRVKVSVFRVQVGLSGEKRDEVGNITTVSSPVVMETLLTNIE